MNEHIGINPDTKGDSVSHYGAYVWAFEALVEALDLKPFYFHAKKGQALIWAANLLYRGAAQKNLKRTRYSPSRIIISSAAAITRHHARFRSLASSITVRSRTSRPRSGSQHAERSRGAEEASEVFGAREAFRPASRTPAGFDPAAYLRANPDVAEARIDPAKHSVEFGYLEGRPLR